MISAHRLLGCWDRLLGRRRRIPRNPDETWAYAEKVGRETGDLESRGKATADAATAMHPTELFLVGLVIGRIANLTRRLARRLQKVKAASKRHEQKARQHAPAIGTKAGSPAGGVVDFFVSRVVTYLLVYGATIWTLEATGMLTSSIAYETALGDMRVPVSVAAGAILLLAGHVAGHLIDDARKNRDARRGYLAGAVVVLAFGALTVVWLGVGRDANTEAVERFSEASDLRVEASRLDRRADRLLQPLPNAVSEEPGLKASAEDRRAAADLHQEAERVRRQAEQVDDEAREERTLGFFVAVQLLGLGVGTAGGFFFAGAAPVREHRKASRHRRRAEASKVKADGLQGEIDSLKREEYGWAIASYGNAEHNRRVARGSITPTQASPGPDEADLIRRMIAAVRRTNGAGDQTRVPDPEERP